MKKAVGGSGSEGERDDVGIDITDRSDEKDGKKGGGEERFAGSARKVTTGASERAGFGNNGLIDLGTSSDGGADHDSASLHLSQAKGLWRPTCCERTAPSCSPPNRHTAVSTVKSSISAAIVRVLFEENLFLVPSQGLCVCKKILEIFSRGKFIFPGFPEAKLNK